MTSRPITCPSCSGPARRSFSPDGTATDLCDSCVRVWVTPAGARGPEISYVPQDLAAEAMRLFPPS